MKGVKALFLSNDPTLFDPASAARARLRAYAVHIGEVHLVSRAPLHGRDAVDGPLHLHAVHAPKGLHLIAIARLARRLVRALDIAVVSAQDPFEYGVAAWCAARGTNAKLHLQAHTDFCSPYFVRGSVKNRIRVLCAGFLLRRATGIRAVSTRIRTAIARRYRRHAPITVIPVTLPARVPLPTPLPTNDFMFSLITLSRLEPEKRIEDLLAALVLVRRQYPGVGLFIVGEGSRRRALMLRARALGLRDHVRFLGWRTDGWSLMESAQAYVSASAYEGYGLSLLEAALGRVPVVTTDVGIVGEVLVPETSALVSRVGDVEALARNILRLIEKNDLRAALALAAREAAEREVAEYADQPALIARDLRATAGVIEPV